MIIDSFCNFVSLLSVITIFYQNKWHEKLNFDLCDHVWMWVVGAPVHNIVDL